MLKPRQHDLNWSQVLKDIREETGLTQKDVAARSGLSQRTVAEYENVGLRRQLSVYKVEKILDVLGYDIDIFIRDRF